MDIEAHVAAVETYGVILVCVIVIDKLRDSL